MKISKLLAAVGVIAFCVSFASVRAQDNPAQAAAREALMKQMNQVQAPEPQTPAAAPTAPEAPAAPVAPAAPAVVVEPAAAAPAAPAAVAAPAVVILQTNVVAAPPASVSIPSPAPIVAPALPISMTKEQRLQALLAQYKSDQITPEQYHTQRAAILAEP